MIEKKESKYKIRLYTNAIILNSIVLILFIFVIFFYLVDWFKEVETKKQELEKKISLYKDLEKNWLSFNEVISKIEDKEKKYSEDFFKEKFSNNTDKTYLEFLNDKREYINNNELSDLKIKRDEMISRVLPSYSRWVFVDWNMVDLDFINYVETILKTFSLKTNSPIWIKEVVPLKDSNKNNKNDLQSEIFYIPLSLKLEWKKSDFLDFLYFSENVWLIDINDDKSEEIGIYSDKYFKRNLIWKISKENIYENQIFDIKNIRFSDYIDTDSSYRQDFSKEWFINFIKSSSWKDEKILVDAELRFFVKWLPLYRIKEFIEKNLIWVYDDISKKVSSLSSKLQTKKINDNSKQIIVTLKKLEEIKLYLKDKENNIKKIRWDLNKNKNLEQLYVQNKDLMRTFNNIKIFLDSIKVINK